MGRYAQERFAGGGAGLFSPGLSGGSEYTYPSTSGTWWPEYVCYNQQPNPCSDIFENIKPENHEKLLADLKDRTGLDIQYFEIGRMFLDRINIKIFYNS